MLQSKPQSSAESMESLQAFIIVGSGDEPTGSSEIKLILLNLFLEFHEPCPGISSLVSRYPWPCRIRK